MGDAFLMGQGGASIKHHDYCQYDLTSSLNLACVDDTHLYFRDELFGSQFKIFKVDKNNPDFSGADSFTVPEVSPNGISQVVEGGDYLYVTVYDYLFQVNKSTGSITNTHVTGDGVSPGVVQDDAYLYLYDYSSSNNYCLVKLRKSDFAVLAEKEIPKNNPSDRPGDFTLVAENPDSSCMGLFYKPDMYAQNPKVTYRRFSKSSLTFLSLNHDYPEAGGKVSYRVMNDSTNIYCKFYRIDTQVGELLLQINITSGAVIKSLEIGSPITSYWSMYDFDKKYICLMSVAGEVVFVDKSTMTLVKETTVGFDFGSSMPLPIFDEKFAYFSVPNKSRFKKFSKIFEPYYSYKDKKLIEF